MRQRIRHHDESVLVRGLTGYASSLAALAGVSDLDLAILVCEPLSTDLRHTPRALPSTVVIT
ncbi:MAG TPA: hypothetical protein VN965_09255 [Candidatus Dormibacteraeota bacterium]|nr:hypothetical protein [Candidatus Dormibacteraeota bacterium]